LHISFMHGIRLQRHASNSLQETPCRSFAARIPSTDVSRGICAHIYNIAVQAALKAIRSNSNEHRHYSSTRRTKRFFLIITTNDLPSLQGQKSCDHFRVFSSSTTTDLSLQSPSCDCRVTGRASSTTLRDSSSSNFTPTKRQSQPAVQHLLQ
jgi:hypothetical protein